MNNLVGRTFTRLTVLAQAASQGGHRRWLCTCTCGTSKVVAYGNLVNGNVKSCGCLRKELAHSRLYKHGQCASRTYSCWLNMKNRCLNKRGKGYAHYGGRGITVCRRWLQFEKFLEDMGPCTAKRSIERVDNNKGYTPSNCIWATYKQQANNRREACDVRKLRFKGESLSLHDWGTRFNLPPQVIRSRLGRGWSMKQALTTTRKIYCKG